MTKTLTVYLHFPCFDGVVSAVLACEYLERKHGWVTGEIVPVNYSARESWLANSLARPAAVVDFLFHPDANFWADHHQTTFLSPDLEAAFRRNSSSDFIYDAGASSCAEVIWRKAHRTLREHRFREMVDWARRIDGARYNSVEEAVLGDAPPLRINLSFLRDSSPDYCRFLVQSLRARSMAEVAASPQVDSLYQDARKAIKNGQKLFRKAARLEQDGIVVFHVEKNGDAIMSRYAPYLEFPQARYSVGITESGRGVAITAMRNPWRRIKSVPLGQIFRHYGGGGHQRVASVLVRNPHEARNTLNSILTDIRNAEHGDALRPKSTVTGD